MFVSVGIGVAAAGAIGAVASSQAQKSAAKRAAGAQRDAATYAADVEKEMYDRGVELQQPFYQTGLAALPYLQSSILGGPVQSADPRYRQMSANDIEQYNRQQELATAGYAPPPTLRLSDTLRANMGTANTSNMLDIDGRYYIGPDGQIVNEAPQISSTFDYTQSPAAKYAGVSLMRGLGARGLAGGGIAPYAQAKLAAEDYDKQVGRLSGLVDIGRGASTSLSNLATGYGDSAANISLNLGNNLAESELAQGKARASLYSTLGSMPAQAAGMYINGKSAGAW